MGGSQSKFSPEPRDAWYRMMAQKEPKFLEKVLQAIVELKDTNGSSQGRIIDYIRNSLSEVILSQRPRNLVMQVKRAMHYAVIHGMVRQRGGKFFLALNQKDYDTFTGLRSMKPMKESSNENSAKNPAKSSTKRKTATNQKRIDRKKENNSAKRTENNQTKEENDGKSERKKE
ncbi:unnamed protein product [Phyllotreta striolata]|uniref:H15 domain-containing protein n=1 Tax=Phyllotreta striolata TaxID=444603 RepID=A0A9N9XP33_PHYSR|nr:unnamed protein product [Phyllotreta striolata]